MKLILVMLSFAAANLFNSCSKSLDLKEGTVELRLHECADGIIAGDDLKLCFDAVVSDSRCPANAMCIWQGTATAKFSFTKNGEPQTFNLSTITMPPAYTKDTILSGYKIEFINLSPYPGTVPAPIPDNQMKAEVKITKM